MASVLDRMKFSIRAGAAGQDSSVIEEVPSGRLGSPGRRDSSGSPQSGMDLTRDVMVTRRCRGAKLATPKCVFGM